MGLILGTAITYTACGGDDPAANYADAGGPIVGATAGAGGTVAGAPAGAGGSTTGGTAGGASLAGGATTGSTGGVRPPTAGGGLLGAIGGATTGSTGSTPGTTGGMTGTGDAGVPGGTGGTGGTAGTGGTGGTAGGGTGGGVVTGGTCPGLPAITDYAAKGPFDVMMKPDVVAGSEGCTLFRPGATLGKDGFKHPIAVWGNGIATTPDQYQKLLGHFVSHGFVVIACNSSNPEQPCLNMCMEWLVKQNASGDMAGKLDTTKEITIGYSWGGGASIDTNPRPNVKATISIHGMPPRQDPWAKMKAPLLLFTSTGDTFVSASGYVTPNYNSSKVTTFYATLQENVGHVYPCDEGSVCDTGGILLGGPAAAAIKEQAPAVAWMRYWACGDENAKKYFFGPDCVLCKSPWKSQSKPMGAFN